MTEWHSGTVAAWWQSNGTVV